MKLKKNWKIKAGFFTKVANLYKKGGFNPQFYIYRYRFNAYPGKFKVGKYPLDVIAEASNVCNLRCSMCFQSDETLPVAKTTKVPLMAMDTFKKIADECAKYRIPALKLSWRGEPMLNKNFMDMVRYAKSKGILEVTSLTNATLMNQNIGREIVEAKLDQLIISIDGFTKQTYEKIRIGADYDAVIENIKNLIDIRGKSRKPFIRLQYTESGINRHETREFYEYWHKRVDEITISYCQEFGSIQKNNPFNVPLHEYCCKQPFQRLVVMTDGTVCVCATDVAGNITIGNVNTASLKDLWNCPKIQELRGQHKSGNYYLSPMCRICAHNISLSNKAANRADQ
ncbi:MAG: radical SAM/SPASM domain-containing protein [Candidatus Omnitrophota bacterium]|jgi:radical SAM protein with 4Fe4S-binding SPASM domain